MKGLNTETLWYLQAGAVPSIMHTIHPWRPTDELRNFHGWIAGIPGYLTHKPTRKIQRGKLQNLRRFHSKCPYQQMQRIACTATEHTAQFIPWTKDTWIAPMLYTTPGDTFDLLKETVA